MSVCAVTKHTQEALSQEFCECEYQVVGRTRSVFVIHLSTRVDAKTRGFGEGLKMNLACSCNKTTHASKYLGLDYT